MIAMAKALNSQTQEDAATKASLVCAAATCESAFPFAACVVAAPLTLSCVTLPHPPPNGLVFPTS